MQLLFCLGKALLDEYSDKLSPFTESLDITFGLQEKLPST